MYSAKTNSRKDPLIISNAELSLGAIVRGVLTAIAFFALLLAVNQAKAQTETVLYDFAGSPDGAYPEGSLTSYNGNFYGTTTNGGANGAGTVFEPDDQLCVDGHFLSVDSQWRACQESADRRGQCKQTADHFRFCANTQR